MNSNGVLRYINITYTIDFVVAPNENIDKLFKTEMYNGSIIYKVGK